MVKDLSQARLAAILSHLSRPYRQRHTTKSVEHICALAGTLLASQLLLCLFSVE
jgi:hypothetical protein